ncbi:MAG: NAD-dependent succinate-semialdehyde dehydrogenase [Porticoccaceae bacterium]|nr:NAD-dependent succinate-semialdehyde dehydrogenase [Alphaproteobacteria bacterium]MDP4746182.1 NAD-dependent succinate-semialdehyde dehydrogenase [Porticoccaceae bacterium]MDP4752825.1 NAD-dependent succinate-semialdehyde dehydrogenase [Porticoccaceae bacterium]MDP4889683.1 NAD-dependent succinate-semialdehyde dehydrogenase [Porticoccaceae bacterium]MDP4988320.1 NAD-dependent succinate-semialdehyde dehydrogenase [Porticoccaceae bacterium]
MLKTQAHINGVWVDADNGETLAVTNPATGELIAEVAKCGTAETRRMIEAAAAAQKLWAQSAVKERAAVLRRWFNLVMENQEDLAQILTAEQGKPLAEARGEIAYGANYIEWFSEESKRVYGDTIAPPANDKRLVVIKQPVGVVACITPWNFPNAMLTRKIAPALAAGCAVVCKPANATPLSALALMELAVRAGMPKGLMNIVTGRTAEIGAELTGNPLVRKVTFTGSTPVGKQLMAECAQTVKRTSMELGGNAPFIVFNDADLDAAVQGALISKYRNAGQTCVCSNRLIIQSGVYDEFAEKLQRAVSALKVGNGADEGVNVGPLIDEKAATTVCEFIDDAVAKGATVALGGGRSELGGTFVQPTILTGVTRAMRVFSEEIFGPVAPLFKFETEAEVIEMANDTEFGLAAYFYSRDIGRVWRVAEQLEYGIVGVNEGIISNEMAPFGGVKESGGGREGSKYGLDDYLEIKYICMGGIDK